MSGVAAGSARTRCYEVELDSGRSVSVAEREPGDTERYFARKNAFYARWLARAEADLVALFEQYGTRPPEPAFQTDDALRLELRLPEGMEGVLFTLSPNSAPAPSELEALKEQAAAVLERHRKDPGLAARPAQRPSPPRPTTVAERLRSWLSGLGRRGS